MAVISSVVGIARRYSHLNWAFADQGLVSGSNVLTGILLARFLGVEEFGAYTLAWAVLLFVASIHLPLIVGSMLSIGPKHSEAEAPAYYGAVVLQNLVFAVVGTLIVLAGTELTKRLVPTWDIGRLSLPLAAATFAIVWHEFLRRYFYARGRAAAAFAVDVVRYLGQIAILLIVFAEFPELLDSGKALWIVAGAATVAAAGGFVFVDALTWRKDAVRSVALRHYETGKWMVASGPIDWASEYVFVFATGTFLGPSAVGVLRACQNVAAVTSIIFLSLINVVSSGSARHYHEGGVAALNAYLGRVTKVGAAATALVCLVFALAPEFWLHFFFGDEFVGYGEFVRWWALVYTVNYFILPLRAGLRALERTRPMFTARAIGAVFAVVASAVLVASLGLRGAVVGILVTKVIIVAVLWRLFRRSMASAPAG